jgi:electron-transferring-flavoprotein dehydrogenase
LADGTQGHLSAVAIEELGLGTGPQTWELGVKEVWRVARPLGRVIHTMGWPLRPQAKFREFGGGFVYPMGEDHVSIGLVAGLDYRDTELSVHDLLQELKQHPLVAPILEGGERVEWGAKTIPSGGFYALPKKFQFPGLLLCGDAAGMVNVPTLKGVHYAMEAGRLAAESAFAALTGEVAPRSDPTDYDDAIRSSFIWSDLRRVRNVRQVFARGFFVGGLLAGLMMQTRGLISLGKVRTEPDDTQPLIRTNRSETYPKPDGKLVFDKLTSVFASGNQTHENQPDHIRLTRKVPADLAAMWVQMCPAQVYKIGESHDDGLVTVEVAPGNCVQCGAISAKGGRLTPPEAGSGPEYVLT